MVRFIYALKYVLKNKLEVYLYSKVYHVYVPMARKYKKRQGLSERQLKKRLEQQGWTVWRGGAINIVRYGGLYPNVKRKYEVLCKVLEEHRPGTCEYLQYLCSVHHGMPDFICYRSGKFKFVECKLGHEQLSHRQKACIRRLKGLGFTVEVHKFVDHCTKTRRAIVDLRDGSKSILEKQMTLTQKWAKT